jgi:hypothetical protein
VYHVANGTNCCVAIGLAQRVSLRVKPASDLRVKTGHRRCERSVKYTGCFAGAASDASGGDGRGVCDVPLIHARAGAGRRSATAILDSLAAIRLEVDSPTRHS